MSGADLANLVNEAALFAVRRGANVVHAEDFDAARDRVLMGLKRESMALTEEEKEVVAYHEGGHAVLAYVLDHADPVHKVTILPTGMALGVTQQLPHRGAPHLQEGVHRRLARRRASAVASPRSSSSATSPPARRTTSCGITELARKMVREWGMSERIGPMAWGSQGAVFLGEDLVHTRDYSDETARVIDEEVERILREEEDRARQVLGEHRPGLDAVAQALLEHETLDGAEVARLVDEAMGRKAGGLRKVRHADGTDDRRRAAARGREPVSDVADRRSSRPRCGARDLAERRARASAGCAELGDRGPEVGGGERADERAAARRRRRRRQRSSGSRRSRSARAGRRAASRRARTSRPSARLEHRDLRRRPWHESHTADEKSATSHGASGRGKSSRSSWRGTGYASRGGGSGRRRAETPRDERRRRRRSRRAISESRHRPPCALSPVRAGRATAGLTDTPASPTIVTRDHDRAVRPRRRAPGRVDVGRASNAPHRPPGPRAPARWSGCWCRRHVQRDELGGDRLGARVHDPHGRARAGASREREHPAPRGAVRAERVATLPCARGRRPRGRDLGDDRRAVPCGVTRRPRRCTTTRSARARRRRPRRPTCRGTSTRCGTSAPSPSSSTATSTSLGTVPKFATATDCRRAARRSPNGNVPRRAGADAPSETAMPLRNGTSRTRCRRRARCARRRPGRHARARASRRAPGVAPSRAPGHITRERRGTTRPWRRPAPCTPASVRNEMSTIASSPKGLNKREELLRCRARSCRPRSTSRSPRPSRTVRPRDRRSPTTSCSTTAGPPTISTTTPGLGRHERSSTPAPRAARARRRRTRFDDRRTRSARHHGDAWRRPACRRCSR